MVSEPAVASRRPSGLKTTSNTFLSCPVSGAPSLPAGVDVPQPNGAVEVGRGEPLSVRAERHRECRTGRALERLSDGLSGVRIPHPHGPAVVAAGDPLPIRADGQAVEGGSGVDDPDGGAALDDGVEQSTGGGIPRQYVRGEQFLNGPNVAAGLGLGHHERGLRHQSTRLRAVALVDGFLTLVHRFLSLAFGFPALHDRDSGGGNRTHGEQRQPGDGGAAQALGATLFAQIFACQFVFGLAVDWGGKVGDFLPEQGGVGIPRGVVADVHEERFGGKHSGLRQQSECGI